MGDFANVFEKAQVERPIEGGNIQISQVQKEIEKLAKSIALLGDKIKGLDDRFKSVLSDIASEPSDKRTEQMKIPILVPLASTLWTLNNDLSTNIGAIQNIINRTQL